MARIVITGLSKTSRDQLARLLSSSGLTVSRTCASVFELRRSLSEFHDGIVIIAEGIAAGSVDEIADDFGDSYQMLLIGRADALSACGSESVFKLAYPCTASAVTAAVMMLTQLHYMRLPHRTGEEHALVERAKRLLMERFRIDEPEAHRRMQKTAMSRGLKTSDYAAMLLQGSEETEV